MVRVAALAALVTLSTVACGGDEEPPSASSATTSVVVSVTPSGAVVAWAGSVCSDVDGLRAAVREVAAAAPADLDASGMLSDQARAEVRAQVDAVRRAGQALLATLRSPPADAGTALSAAADDLSESGARALTQIDAMWTAAMSVAAATTEADAKAALTALRSAALSAGTAITTYVSDLRLAIGNSDGSVKSAFAAAPACQEIPFTESP
jgi:hypothetical protein